MASFTDVVKGQAVSLANQGFKKVAGNLRGVVGSSLNRGEPTDNPALTPRLDPKAFTFPLDVTNTDQGLGNHGHYILFFINEQEESKISFGKKEASSRGFANTLKAQAQNGIASEVRTFVDKASGGFFETVSNKLGLDNLIDGLAGSQSFTSAVAGSDEFNKGSTISQSKNTALVTRKATTEPALETIFPATLPAAEAELALRLHGISTELFLDVGVAGLHRLLDQIDEIKKARVIIACAGMEGALPTVLAGLVPQPVIGVPISVGYGVSSQGRSALDGMLSSCAPGLVVVNIDNGYGAAMAALRVMKSDLAFR